MEANDLKQELTYLRCITSLGIMYLVQGRNNDAAENITYALTHSSEVLGQKSAAYAANLNSQAKLDQLSGKYNEAEIAFDQVITIIQKVFGEKSMQYAIVLNNKALLYQAMGRFPESVELMKRSIAASEAAPKKVTQSGNPGVDGAKPVAECQGAVQREGSAIEIRPRRASASAETRCRRPVCRRPHAAITAQTTAARPAISLRSIARHCAGALCA